MSVKSYDGISKKLVAKETTTAFLKEKILKASSKYHGFKFYLRGNDSLAFKWIANERSSLILKDSDGQETGAKLNAVLDYFYITCKLNKQFPVLSTLSAFKEWFFKFSDNKK